MKICKAGFLSIILSVFLLLSGTGCVSVKKVSIESQGITLQPIVEKTLAELEFAYDSGSLKDFRQILDRDFEEQGKFLSVLESYFSSVKNPRIHFVIDMVVADKNGIVVRCHWFKRGLTGSSVVIELEGSSQFLFKRYPGKILKLNRIIKGNPFFY